jgi:hypothetical protein
MDGYRRNRPSLTHCLQSLATAGRSSAVARHIASSQQVREWSGDRPPTSSGPCALATISAPVELAGRISARLTGAEAATEATFPRTAANAFEEGAERDYISGNFGRYTRVRLRCQLGPQRRRKAQ